MTPDQQMAAFHKAENIALLETLESQDGQQAEDGREFMDSLVGFHVDSDGELEIADDELDFRVAVDPKKPISSNIASRNVSLNTIGTVGKQLAAHKADRLAMHLQKEAEDEEDEEFVAPEKEYIDLLEKASSQLQVKHGDDFIRIRSIDTALKAKMKQLQQIKAKQPEHIQPVVDALSAHVAAFPDAQTLKEYQAEEERQKRKKPAKSKPETTRKPALIPLSGIGPEKLKKSLSSLPLKELSDEESDGSDGATTSRKKKKPAPKPKKQVLDTQSAISAWAAKYGGKAKYGSSDGNNCLIYAISNGLDQNLGKAKVDSIREALAEQDLPGVNANGYLPGYPRVIDNIAQFIMSQMELEDLPGTVGVRLETIIPNIAPVHTNPDADVQVYIFHDGSHYWWLKKA